MILYVKNENIIYSRRRIFRLSWNHTHATVSNVVPNLVVYNVHIHCRTSVIIATVGKLKPM